MAHEGKADEQLFQLLANLLHQVQISHHFPPNSSLFHYLLHFSGSTLFDFSNSIRALRVVMYWNWLISHLGIVEIFC